VLGVASVDTIYYYGGFFVIALIASLITLLVGLSMYEQLAGFV